MSQPMPEHLCEAVCSTGVLCCNRLLDILWYPQQHSNDVPPVPDRVCGSQDMNKITWTKNSCTNRRCDTYCDLPLLLLSCLSLIHVHANTHAHAHVYGPWKTKKGSLGEPGQNLSNCIFVVLDSIAMLCVCVLSCFINRNICLIVKFNSFSFIVKD